MDRILTDTERRQMACKPGALSDVPKVRVSRERRQELAKLAQVTEHICFAEMESMARRLPEIEFVIHDRAEGSVWIVNTEGYNYARYAGKVVVG